MEARRLVKLFLGKTLSVNSLPPNREGAPQCQSREDSIDFISCRRGFYRETRGQFRTRSYPRNYLPNVRVSSYDAEDCYAGNVIGVVPESEIGVPSCAIGCTLRVGEGSALSHVRNRLKTWDEMTGFVPTYELKAIEVRTYSSSTSNLKIFPIRILSLL
jgi:hypothetical protein